MNDNGTYQQQRRGRAHRALVRDDRGRFVAQGAKPCPTCKNSAQALKEKADKYLDVMLSLTQYDKQKCLESREYPLPIYRAVIYEKLYNDGFSKTQIGKAFGKSHCTVIHSLDLLRELREIGDKKVLELCMDYEIELNKPKAKTNDMSKLFFTEVSFAGGQRKVEADIWPAMIETFRHAIVAEEHLETLKANLEQLVEKRAAELKVKAVPVTLSPEWDKLKAATLPRFLSVGRITVTLTEVRRVIGKDNEEAAV